MNKFKALIEVKKIIALILTIIFCFLSVMGKVEPKDFLTVFLIVIAFYFSQSAVRDAVAETKTPTVILPVETPVNKPVDKPVQPLINEPVKILVAGVDPTP